MNEKNKNSMLEQWNKAMEAVQNMEDLMLEIKGDHAEYIRDDLTEIEVDLNDIKERVQEL